MNFSRRERQDVDVNLTPLIDVVFLLLIFFMVSTTFTRESHMAINLPEATPEASPLRATPIEISISSSGEYAINQVGLVNARLDTLVSALQKVSGGNSEQPLVISADANTPHQSVVTAMDAAGQLGFSTLSISTKNVVEN
ncbi:MAG: biopolymer transporter ExbD [Pseudomonadota bacterium]